MCNAQTPQSRIVVINNAIEEKWVIHNDRIKDTTSGSWMGCSDANSEGHWVCDDTSGTYWTTVSDHQGYWGYRKYYIIEKVKIIYYSKNPKLANMICYLDELQLGASIPIIGHSLLLP